MKGFFRRRNKILFVERNYLNKAVLKGRVKNECSYSIISNFLLKQMLKSQTNSSDLIIVYSKLNISNVCVSNRNVIETLSYLVKLCIRNSSYSSHIKDLSYLDKN